MGRSFQAIFYAILVTFAVEACKSTASRTQLKQAAVSSDAAGTYELAYPYQGRERLGGTKHDMAVAKMKARIDDFGTLTLQLLGETDVNDQRLIEEYRTGSFDMPFSLASKMWDPPSASFQTFNDRFAANSVKDTDKISYLDTFQRLIDAANDLAEAYPRTSRVRERLIASHRLAAAVQKGIDLSYQPKFWQFDPTHLPAINMLETGLQSSGKSGTIFEISSLSLSEVGIVERDQSKWGPLIDGFLDLLWKSPDQQLPARGEVTSYRIWYENATEGIVVNIDYLNSKRGIRDSAATLFKVSEQASITAENAKFVAAFRALDSISKSLVNQLAAQPARDFMDSLRTAVDGLAPEAAIASARFLGAVPAEGTLTTSTDDRADTPAQAEDSSAAEKDDASKAPGKSSPSER